MKDLHAHQGAKTNDTEEGENELVLSFLAVRRAVGSLGLLLPIMLLLVAVLSPRVDFMPSISEFYFSPVRELLVATIGAISVFLFSYTGFSAMPDRIEARPIERFLTDRNVSFAAATGALGVALFPTTCGGCTLSPEPYTRLLLGEGAAGNLHAFSALLFFVALGTMSYENFTRHKLGEQRSTEQLAEDRMFRSLGALIYACALILIVLIKGADFWPALAAFNAATNAVFWVEAVGLAAFSASWFLKGDTMRPVVRGVAKLVKAPPPAPNPELGDSPGTETHPEPHPDR